MVFALGLFRNATRRLVNLIEASIAAGLYLGWITGSVLLLCQRLLPPQGSWALVSIADIVLAFAIPQFLGFQ